MKGLHRVWRISASSAGSLFRPVYSKPSRNRRRTRTLPGLPWPSARAPDRPDQAKLRPPSGTFTPMLISGELLTGRKSFAPTNLRIDADVATTAGGRRLRDLLDVVADQQHCGPEQVGLRAAGVVPENIVGQLSLCCCHRIARVALRDFRLEAILPVTVLFET